MTIPDELSKRLYGPANLPIAGSQPIAITTVPSFQPQGPSVVTVEPDGFALRDAGVEAAIAAAVALMLAGAALLAGRRRSRLVSA